MKKLLLFFVFCFSIPAVFATEASKFAEMQYQKQYTDKPVNIVVKKEHTEEYMQKIGNQLIPAITYGYGDMRIKGCKKQRISYICLLNDKYEPVWSYIIHR